MKKLYMENSEELHTEIRIGPLVLSFDKNDSPQFKYKVIRLVVLSALGFLLFAVGCLSPLFLSNNKAILISGIGISTGIGILVNSVIKAIKLLKSK